MKRIRLQKFDQTPFGGNSLLRRVLTCTLFLAVFNNVGIDAQPSSADPASADPKWWLSLSLGDGQVKLQSDEQSSDRGSAFAIGFDLGRKIGPWARVGMEANGWLLQAFDLNNPAVGESVGYVAAIGDALPSQRYPFFVRGGIGRSTYSGNRPNVDSGGGLDWLAGGGYEFPVSRSLRLVPIVGYSAGNLGNGGTPNPQTHFRYSTMEFKLALHYRFGR